MWIKLMAFCCGGIWIWQVTDTWLLVQEAIRADRGWVFRRMYFYYYFKWRNHWLQVAYGLPRPILVQPNDSLQLRGSHNKDSFWFNVEKVGTNKNEDFVGRQRCTCQWHSTVSPNTLLRWNTVYEQSVFVREIVEVNILLFKNECSTLLGIPK